jgi:hypothetical protein
MKFLRWLFKSRQDESKQAVDQESLQKELDQWLIVTAENERSGESAVFRIRMTRPTVRDLGFFTTAISVNWSYDTDTGMPSPETKESMDAFEDSVDPITGDNEFAELMYVATGGGKREWLIYTSDQERFMNELNDLLAGDEPYPLEIELYEDPEWSIWAEIAQAVEEREDAN